MTIMVIMINSKVYLNDYKRQKNNNYDGDDEKAKKTFSVTIMVMVTSHLSKKYSGGSPGINSSQSSKILR